MTANPTTATRTGEPCWIELLTPDAEAAVAFYGAVAGWAAGDASPEFGGYRMFLHGETPVAGLMPNDGTLGPNGWTVYLAVDDVEATTERARARGAQVVAEPMQVADLGRMAAYVDPTGAAVGAWQGETFGGFGVHARDGVEFAPAWFEVLSRDYSTAVDFYTDVFGWETDTMSDTPELRYTTLGEGDDARAGIMDARDLLGEEPSRWQFYLGVPDTDAAVERALAAGGRLEGTVEDTPYGRLAELRDPAGLRFCVMGPNAQAG